MKSTTLAAITLAAVALTPVAASAQSTGTAPTRATHADQPAEAQVKPRGTPQARPSVREQFKAMTAGERREWNAMYSG